MSNLLTFLRPIPLAGVKRVLVVQTGEADVLQELLPRVRGLFGEAELEVLLREGDAGLRDQIEVHAVRVARWEERYALLPELRGEVWDVVVMPVGGATTELRLLPFLMRTRSLVAFDEEMAARAVTLPRLPGVAAGLGLLGRGDSRLAIVRHLMARTLVAPLVGAAALCVLLADNIWLRLRPRRRKVAAPARAHDS